MGKLRLKRESGRTGLLMSKPFSTNLYFYGLKRRREDRRRIRERINERKKKEATRIQVIHFYLN